MGSAELLLVSGLFLAAVSVYLFTTFVFASNQDEEVLSWASGKEPAKSKSALIEFSRPLVHNFTLRHARRIKSEDYRRKVEKRILTAGLSREINVDEYIGLQILWGVMFPFVLSVFNFALELGYPYPVTLGIGLVGVAIPKFYCENQRKARYVAVVTDLPFFIDLLALSTEAGLEFFNAIGRIVDSAEDSVLADELRQVLDQIRYGSSRQDALRGLADRLDIPEITSFVSVLIDADDTGSSITKVLQEQSQQMRLERFVRAEKAGARASQLMLFPLMIFIMPAVFIMVFGPVIIQFFYGGN